MNKLKDSPLEPIIIHIPPTCEHCGEPITIADTEDVTNHLWNYEQGKYEVHPDIGTYRVSCRECRGTLEVDNIDDLTTNYDAPASFKVHPHAYGYCPNCKTVHDFWRTGDIDFKCPSCSQPLETPNVETIIESIFDCIEDECFEEQYAYPVPLMPEKIQSEVQV